MILRGQADTIVPNAGDSAAYDRYAYVKNNPVKYTDPSGHCSFSTLSVLVPVLGIASCIQDYGDAYNDYREGVRDPGHLYLEATGLKDAIVSLASETHQLNQDVSTVFSNKPLAERLGPSYRLGTFAVGTAANIVSGVQAARGMGALSRSGPGGNLTSVEGTQRIETFKPGDELYRAYGGTSRQESVWAFTKNPGNRITAISKGALQPGNTAESMTTITFSGQVRGEVSRVARLFGQPGGYTQVHLPWKNPYVHFSTGRALPYGFMPFVPYNPYERREWR